METLRNPMHKRLWRPRASHKQTSKHPDCSCQHSYLTHTWKASGLELWATFKDYGLLWGAVAHYLGLLGLRGSWAGRIHL